MNNQELFDELSHKISLNFAWINTLELPLLTEAIELKDEFLPKVVAFFEGNDIQNNNPLYEYAVHIGAFSEENLRNFLFNIFEGNSSVRKKKLNYNKLATLLDNNKIEWQDNESSNLKDEL